jgi:hypothetical protein
VKLVEDFRQAGPGDLVDEPPAAHQPLAVVDAQRDVLEEQCVRAGGRFRGEPVQRRAQTSACRHRERTVDTGTLGPLAAGHTLHIVSAVLTGPARFDKRVDTAAQIGVVPGVSLAARACSLASKPM